MDQPDKKNQKGNTPHEALLLSNVVSQQKTIKISFPDGEYLIDQLRWHTLEALGLKSGKVVYKQAIKYWEITDL